MTTEKRLLVIDDEERMADSVRALLSNHDYRVDVAYGGKDGLKKLQEETYDVVITDLRMPEVDGYAVLGHLQTKLPHVLAIVVTGHGSTESVIEALHYRAFDYLQKPFEFDTLKECVERAFAKIDSDRMREDMISMITHDIKIPLSSIVGFAAMIFDAKGELHARAREFVRTIRLNGQKIESLIDNFLTTCKIEAGKLNLFHQPLNVQFILEDLLDLLRLDIERQGQKLETSYHAAQTTISGDEHLLSRALGNILSNAIKYTPTGGTIRVETQPCPAAQSPLAADSIQIVVRNTGPGIAPDQLGGVFEKYQRASNIRGIEGTGIGLYVVKFVVDHHNGHVTLTSTPGDVTTTTVTLPLASARA